MEQTKVFVFDFGGVIFNTSADAAYREIFEERGRNQDEVAPFLTDIFTKSLRSAANLGTMKAVTDELTARHPEWAAEIHAFDADRDFIKNVRGTIAGMPEMIVTLAKAGHKVYGLTNWAADTYQTLRKAYPDIFANIEMVVVSGEVEMKKPSPEIFRLAAEKFGNPDPATVYYFDDKPANIKAAELAVGWNGIVFDQSREGVGAVRSILNEALTL